MLKKLIKGAQKLVGDILPGDTEKYLGTIVGLATGNPLLAAGAGYLGGGTTGAISGGLSGLLSPGYGAMGKFAEVGGTGIMSKLTGATTLGGSPKLAASTLPELFLGTPAGGPPGTPSVSGVLGKGGKLFGDLGTAQKFGLGALGAITLADVIGEEDQQKEITAPKLVTTDETLGGDELYAYSRPDIFYPEPSQKRGELVYDYGTIPYYAAMGGTPEFPRENGIGAIEGPGTETSDSIPAMLSDGEFVMNANAVKGAGYAAGARDEYEARRLGAQKMYETMDQLEAVA